MEGKENFMILEICGPNFPSKSFYQIKLHHLFKIYILKSDPGSDIILVAGIQQ